jgi:hypothetical protein
VLNGLKRAGQEGIAIKHEELVGQEGQSAANGTGCSDECRAVK